MGKDLEIDLKGNFGEEITIRHYVGPDINTVTVYFFDPDEGGASVGFRKVDDLSLFIETLQRVKRLMVQQAINSYNSETTL